MSRPFKVRTANDSNRVVRPEELKRAGRIPDPRKPQSECATYCFLSRLRKTPSHRSSEHKPDGRRNVIEALALHDAPRFKVFETVRQQPGLVDSGPFSTVNAR